MSDGYTIRRISPYGDYVAVFEFDAVDCIGIADALGPDDEGAAEMLRAADELRRLGTDDSGFEDDL